MKPTYLVFIYEPLEKAAGVLKRKPLFADSLEKVMEYIEEASRKRELLYIDLLRVTDKVQHLDTDNGIDTDMLYKKLIELEKE